MENNQFQNREVDKIKLEKSKELMWKFIQKKSSEMEDRKASGILNSLKTIFLAPKRLIPAGVIAVLLIIAIILNSNFGAIMNKDDFFDVKTVKASFEMTADKEDSSGVETNSLFTLKASEDLSPDDIKNNLKVEPQTEINVTKTGDKEYKITPVNGLEPDKIYNFSIVSDVTDELTGQTTQKEFSWAYQIKDTFKITGTLPGDQTTRIPLDTGIEINFSHEGFDFENFKDYFEISPSVDGNFEHHQKTLSFVPKGGLKETTLYSVKIKKGLPLLASDQALQEDYNFQFETDSKERQEERAAAFGFTQTYYEVSTNSEVALGFYNDNWQAEAKNFTVDIYKFRSSEDYLTSLKNRISIPDWSYFTMKNYIDDTLEMDKIGSFEGVVDSPTYNSWTKYIYFPNKQFEPGSYIFERVLNGKHYQTLVQITDLSAYMNFSITDSIIWVNDVKTKAPVKNAQIGFIDRDETYTTNDQGIAKFATPEDFKVNWKDAINNIVKITSPDNKTIFTEFFASYDDYQSQYFKSFTTDRPVYKPTDTIKYYGFIKSKDSNKKLDDLVLKLEYSHDTFIDEKKINLENNSFSGEIKLNTVASGYYYLNLYSNDKEIISQNIQVSDYVKPAYNLEVQSNKKAVFGGDKINFNIESVFFDGTKVPNLQFNYNISSSISDNKTMSTDSNGKTGIEIAAPKREGKGDAYELADSEVIYMDAVSTLAEESDIRDSVDVQNFYTKLAISAETKDVKEKNAAIKISTNWIDLDKINSGKDDSYLGDKAENRKISGQINEFYWEKVELGEYYDYINKVVKKSYDYEKKENIIKNFEVTTNNNGEAEYSFEINPDRNYEINLKGPDNDDNYAHSGLYIWSGESRSNSYNFYNVKILNGEDPYNVGDRWEYPSRERNFDIGETVETVMANDQAPVTKLESGQLLFIETANGIREYSVQDSPFYSFEFTKKDVPNINISGVWFTGTEYKAIYGVSAKYKSELENLNVEVVPDKDSYSPGDKVNLKVKVRDLDNNSSKTQVNINLVDEAYYKIIYDNFIDPLDEIYSSSSSGEIASVSTHNPIKDADGGKGGCFTGDTQILMADGTYKPIKNIVEGDRVLTKEHPYSSAFVSAKVTNTVSHFVSEYLVINENLGVTGEHVIFINGKWQLAAKAKIGDSLLKSSGENEKILSIRQALEPVWVYNFEVKNQHTYFADNFYVHNDKGGDGIRNDFEDTALFETITTDDNGDGEVNFQLPDNITSWRVVAKAIDTENLKAGASVSNIKVSLPFFSDLIMNREYSIFDKPIIKFRAYGDKLQAGDDVKFNITAKSLGSESSDVNGKAFEGSYFELPELKLGNHEVVVKAESSDMRDALSKPITVKGSRLSKNVTELIQKLENEDGLKFSDNGETEISLMDGGAAYYYSDLKNLYYETGDRLDQKLSRIIAGEILNKYFDEGVEIDDIGDMIQNYEKNGLLLLPYADPDLRLTSLALAMDNNPERFENMSLRTYLNGFYQNAESNFDEIIFSLLGLASIKDPVLLSLRQIKDEPALTAVEKMYIGLAFEKLGSKEEAEAQYNSLKNEIEKKDADTYLTALGALLASSLGHNEDAAKYWEYVELRGIKDDILNLYKAGYIVNSLDYVNDKPVKFNIKINEHNKDVELGKFEKFDFMASKDDKIDLSVSQGDLSSVIKYSVGIDPKDFKKDDKLSITRKYYVNGVETNTFKEGDMVNVKLQMKYSDCSKAYNSEIAEDSASGEPKQFTKLDNYRITDILPSGLKVTSFGRNDTPYKIVGQEEYFGWSCKYNSPEIIYNAKVVTPGEYYAEPAKMESYFDPAVATISEEAKIKIEK